MGEMSLSHRLGNAFGATKGAENDIRSSDCQPSSGKWLFGNYLLKPKLYYDQAMQTIEVFK
jgi:hypothetical protein